MTGCRELLGAVDWSQTSLGPYEGWPQSLKCFVAMVLEMPTPAVIFWGPDQNQLYNDGYSVIMGPRHPRYFGAPYRECWPDTFPVTYSMMQRALLGEAIQAERQLLVLTRHGFTEEAYFTFTFTPLRDDRGAIVGILQPVVEVTQQVLAERRVETLRALAPADAVDAAEHAAQVLEGNPRDVPFALFYSGDAGREAGREPSGELRLRARCGIAAEHAPELAPAIVAGAHAARRAIACDARELLGGHAHLGPWGEATQRAFVLPVTRSGADAPRGVLVFGVSPRLAFDDRYRELFEAIGREVAAGLDAEAAKRAEHELLARAEAARAEAEAERRRLHSIFIQAPVAITILSGPAQVIEMANPAMCRLWDRTLEEVLGRPLLDAIPELAGQGIDALLAGVRATGKPYVGTEQPVRIRRSADGVLEERYFNFVYDPLLDAAGRITAAIIVASDVTVQVLARQAAQRANRAKDEFLAMLGHELRNPLAPIFTALELLRMRGVDGVSARECAVIDRQARHLAGLVEDLLDVSRITSGKIELKRRPLDLADILAEAVETASPLLEKRRHELHVEVPPRLMVDADPARLTQVFANLLTNAAKYTDPGGRISIEARRDDGGYVVEVSDTGRGIAPEMLPRLFDLFVQEAQNLNRAEGGLGLGLSIVKSLVALHGGTVEARSAGPGHGSTFAVHLPPAATRPAALPVHVPAALPRGSGVTPLPGHIARAVLVVDDNEDAAFLLAEALGARGHTCTIAHDGPRALELARATRFDVVLLDIGLPLMDGYEVARHLRALPGGRDLMLVAITGYGQPADKELSLAAGFDHHLVKPVPLGALVKLLDDAPHGAPGGPPGGAPNGPSGDRTHHAAR